MKQITAKVKPQPFLEFLSIAKNIAQRGDGSNEKFAYNKILQLVIKNSKITLNASDGRILAVFPHFEDVKNAYDCVRYIDGLDSAKILNSMKRASMDTPPLIVIEDGVLNLHFYDRKERGDAEAVVFLDKDFKNPEGLVLTYPPVEEVITLKSEYIAMLRVNSDESYISNILNIGNQDDDNVIDFIFTQHKDKNIFRLYHEVSKFSIIPGLTHTIELNIPDTPTPEKIEETRTFLVSYKCKILNICISVLDKFKTGYTMLIPEDRNKPTKIIAGNSLIIMYVMPCYDPSRGTNQVHVEGVK